MMTTGDGKFRPRNHKTHQVVVQRFLKILRQLKCIFYFYLYFQEFGCFHYSNRMQTSNIGCGRMYFVWFGFYYLTNKAIRSLASKSFIF